MMKLVASDSENIGVRLDDATGQRLAVALRPFAVDEVLASFAAANVSDCPSRMTVQISEREHINLLPENLSFINHSCDPNVHFDVELNVIIACRSIGVGDELTFFYPSTEWDMAKPFDCYCRSARCAGRISGASQIALHHLEQYRLSPHILQLAHAHNRLRRGGVA